MDAHWKLLTALFLIGLSWVLFMVGYVLGGSMFQNVPSILLLYGSLFCGVIGAVKGIFAIIDHNRE